MRISEKADGEGACAKVAKFCTKCCCCLFVCLERCVKYINRMAYIEVNLYGYAFWDACKAAYATISMNILQVATFNVVGFFIFLTIKLVVVFAIFIISYNWLDAEHKRTGNIPLWGIVCFFICFVSWFIAAAFADIYEMAADTLLICFCEDRETNKDGTLLAPPGLVALLAKKELVRDKEKPDGSSKASA